MQWAAAFLSLPAFAYTFLFTDLKRRRTWGERALFFVVIAALIGWPLGLVGGWGDVGAAGVVAAGVACLARSIWERYGQYLITAKS